MTVKGNEKDRTWPVTSLVTSRSMTLALDKKFGGGFWTSFEFWKSAGNFLRSRDLGGAETPPSRQAGTGNSRTRRGLTLADIGGRFNPPWSFCRYRKNPLVNLAEIWHSFASIHFTPTLRILDSGHAQVTNLWRHVRSKSTDFAIYWSWVSFPTL